MCGIAGIINFDRSPVSRDALSSMMKIMKHRGPNDEGIYIDRDMGFCHVRLSILDLSESGRQPMFSNDGRFCIIYNGEIFNYIELRKELGDKYSFKTGTDTEVILAAFQEWGSDCLEKFNGMWAFAIYDKMQRSVFIARDRYGVKPLFYYTSGTSFIFASEIKALYHLLKDTLSIDDTSVYEFLVYSRTDQTIDTFIKEIKRVQHGHIIRISGKDVRFEQWYKLSDRLGQSWKCPEEYRDILSSAVEIRLRSDVPVGVCLSGGLDSSSITSIILNDFNRHDLYAFSAVYGEGRHGDESHYINYYKPALSNLKFIYPTEQTFLDDFDSFMNCHFEPVPTLSIYSQFKVIKEASKYVTVALDGQGADEQLGGYHNFFGSYYVELLHDFHLFRFFSELIDYLKHHHSTLALQFLLFYLLPNGIKDYLGRKRLGWINDDFLHSCYRESNIAELLFNPKSLNESLLQHFEYKLEHNLKWNDLNSMYFSIELRVPFMDYRIVEKTLSTPSDQIIKDGYTKWILRQAMKGTLPEMIRLRQDKVGFENPSDDWLKNKIMQSMIFDVLNSETLKNSGYILKDECIKKYERHLRGELNINKEIWQWISLYYLLQKFN